MYTFGHNFKNVKNERFTLFWSLRPTCTSNFIIVNLKQVKLYHFLQKGVKSTYCVMSLSTGLDLEFDLTS